MSNTLQVFSPSLRCVHVSGRLRRNASRVVGVRARSATVACRSCCMAILSREAFVAAISARIQDHGQRISLQRTQGSQWETCPTHPPYWHGSDAPLPSVSSLPEAPVWGSRTSASGVLVQEVTHAG